MCREYNTESCAIITTLQLYCDIFNIDDEALWRQSNALELLMKVRSIVGLVESFNVIYMVMAIVMNSRRLIDRMSTRVRRRGRQHTIPPSIHPPILCPHALGKQFLVG